MSSLDLYAKDLKQVSKSPMHCFQALAFFPHIFFFMEKDEI